MDLNTGGQAAGAGEVNRDERVVGSGLAFDDGKVTNGKAGHWIVVEDGADALVVADDTIESVGEV